MKKQKKNQASLSVRHQNHRKNVAVFGVKDNGIVIDTTDEAFSGGIVIDLLKIYK